MEMVGSTKVMDMRMVPIVHENVHRFEVTVEHTADESMMASATSQAIAHIGANNNGFACCV